MGAATLQPLSAHTLTGALTIQSAVTKPAAKTSSSPPKKGSLSLFFRKVRPPPARNTCPCLPVHFTVSHVLSQVYHLASVRLRDLCARLDISCDLRRKIWTCFEYSLVHCTEMMKDRHLDQLLMCAVYVTAKVCACLHTCWKRVACSGCLIKWD